MRDNAELLRLLDAYGAASDDARPAIEARIRDTYATDQAELTLDMSGFSVTIHRHGIVFYLSLIRQMNRITHLIVVAHGGTVVKFEADNVFAVFPGVAEAIEAAIEINDQVDERNVVTEDIRNIFLKIGIDYGEVLLIEAPGPMRSADLFGDAVNQACKLGEDMAARKEILVSERASASACRRAGTRTRRRSHTTSPTCIWRPGATVTEIAHERRLTQAAERLIPRVLDACCGERP